MTPERLEQIRRENKKRRDEWAIFSEPPPPQFVDDIDDLLEALEEATTTLDRLEMHVSAMYAKWHDADEEPWYAAAEGVLREFGWSVPEKEVSK